MLSRSASSIVAGVGNEAIMLMLAWSPIEIQLRKPVMVYFLKDNSALIQYIALDHSNDQQLNINCVVRINIKLFF